MAGHPAAVLLAPARVLRWHHFVADDACPEGTVTVASQLRGGWEGTGDANRHRRRPCLPEIRGARKHAMGVRAAAGLTDLHRVQDLATTQNSGAALQRYQAARTGVWILPDDTLAKHI